jgi:hypothetical protein
MKIFLDDIRVPSDCVTYMHSRIGNMTPIYLEEWNIVRNYDEFVEVVTQHYNEIECISFDHDLAHEHYDPSMYERSNAYDELYSDFKEKTGYDCAKWLKAFYEEKEKMLPAIIVHSMNPVGTQNIVKVFR